MPLTCPYQCMASFCLTWPARGGCSPACMYGSMQPVRERTTLGVMERASLLQAAAAPGRQGVVAHHGARAAVAACTAIAAA